MSSGRTKVSKKSQVRRATNRRNFLSASEMVSVRRGRMRLIEIATSGATNQSSSTGAAAGKAAGDKLNQVDGVELEIKKENGESIVVVQKANPTFVPGARVRMTQGNGTINVAVVN